MYRIQSTRNVRRALLIAACAASAAIAADALWSSLAPRSAAIEGEGLEEGEGRAAWELMRLRDPVTGRIPDGIRAQELAFAATLPRRSNQPLLFKGAAVRYDWTSIGPVNIGGRTRGIALDVSGEDTVIAAGVSGGIYRSSDAGRSWQRVTLPSQLPGISCLVQDTRPGHTATWYAGTGELLGNSASGGRAFYCGDGMFKSTDNGRSWKQLSSTSSGTPHTFDRVLDNVWRIAIDASDTTREELYAAVYGTIMRSFNGGASWSTALGGLHQTPTGGEYSGYYTEVATTSTGVVYATISSDGWRKGIYRSTNGTSWTEITPPDMPAQYNRVSIGISPSQENTVYFLAETPGTGVLGRNFRGDSSWHHLWRYTWLSGDGRDTGGRWEDLTSRLPMYGRPHGDFFSQGSYDLFVRVDPFNPLNVFVGGTNLYRSSDGFATREAVRWIGGYHNMPFDSTVHEDLEYPNHHPDLHEIAFSRSHPGTVYTGSDGGVHRTDDPAADSVEWTRLNAGYRTSQFYTLAIRHDVPGDKTVIGGLQDNGTWMTTNSDPLKPWGVVGGGDGAWCAFDGSRSLYVSKQLGKTYRVVLDGAGNVVNSTRIDPLGARGYLFINPFAPDPNDGRILYLAGGHILWRNSDVTAIPMQTTQMATANWSQIQGTALPDTVYLTTVSVSTQPANRVYYGTSDGRVFRIDGADQGDPTPSDVTGPGFPANGYVNCIAIDPIDADRAIVVFSNYSVQSLFSTTDGGASWTAISGNLEQNANGSGAGPSCRWVSILHRPNGTLYLVGTSVGLFSTTTLAGMSTGWTQEGTESIGNVVVDMIDVRQSDGFVAVATHGGGIWTTTIDVAGIRGQEDNQSVVLSACRPDPVRSSGEITIEIPAHLAGERALLRVFDLRGREVARLVDGPVGAGRRVARFDVAGMAISSGRYFYRLEIGDAHVTRSLDVQRY